MSLMVNGELCPNWLESEVEDGAFVRKSSQFRNWVTRDGSPGPTGKGGFRAEPDRYHLYISFACPWAHRTLIFRKLKGLEKIISVSVVDPYMGEQGWKFSGYPGSTPDHNNDFEYLYQAYALADPDYSGIVTVPVLWDKQNNTIVNNESSEIIRMLNSAFSEFASNDYDYYPESLRSEIDEINETIYANINDGVYRCGFAQSQAVYEKAFDALFSVLDLIEERLSRQRYLTGPTITEADWRLFPTLLRFDPVYVGHFKCNLRRIADYPQLSNYLRDLYQQSGIAETVHLDHIKRHYYYSHESINPTRIIPKGPELNYDTPHDRERFS